MKKTQLIFLDEFVETASEEVKKKYLASKLLRDAALGIISAFNEGATEWMLGEDWQGSPGILPTKGSGVIKRAHPCFCGRGVGLGQPCIETLTRGRWRHTTDCFQKIAPYLAYRTAKLASKHSIQCALDPEDRHAEGLAERAIFLGDIAKAGKAWVPLLNKILEGRRRFTEECEAIFQDLLNIPKEQADKRKLLIEQSSMSEEKLLSVFVSTFPATNPLIQAELDDFRW